MSAALAPLKDAKTILLTTYKRDGSAVDTPVSIAFDGGRAYFRSSPRLTASCGIARCTMSSGLGLPFYLSAGAPRAIMGPYVQSQDFRTGRGRSCGVRWMAHGRAI